MVSPRIAFAIAIAIILVGGNAHAQATTDERAWAFSASVYTYVVPDSQNYVQPTVTADHGWFHLKRATTTKASTPARCGSAATSAAGRS